MKNLVTDTNTTVPHVAGSDLVSGAVIESPAGATGRVLIAKNDIANGVSGPAFVRNVEVEVEKTTGAAWGEGQVINYNQPTDKFGTAAGTTRAGRATRAALSADTKGFLDLGAL